MSTTLANSRHYSFLPRDATLARRMLWPGVRPSVSLSHAAVLRQTWDWETCGHIISLYVGQGC